MAGALELEMESENEPNDCETIWPVFISEIGQILRLFWGSRTIHDRHEIIREIESIERAAFSSHRAARKIVFASNSRCRAIHRFSSFPALARIESPSSVKLISADAFRCCARSPWW
jgi:hypothetical protein